MFNCRNCDKETSNINEVCAVCYRNPKTNNCTECSKHLPGICYPYVCGECIKKTK